MHKFYGGHICRAVVRKIQNMITIIKTEISNSYSVQKSLDRIGYKSLITDKKDDIKNASMIILPGVGSFDALVRSLEDNDLISFLKIG